MPTLPTFISRGRLLAALLIAGVLAGCGAPSAVAPTAAPAATAAPTAAAPTAEPTAAPAAEPTAAAAPTAEPTAAPAAGVLPAPLYVLNSQQQIVRLEADGKTSAQVTNEDAPISGFAVSPADSTLLYVVGQPVPNKLVRADAHGGARAELLTGQVSQPVWSPDGRRYAFSWGDGPQGAGVYSAEAQGGAPKLLVANLARAKDGSKPGQLRTPIAWSPDGQRLLLMTAPDNGPDAPGGDIGVVGMAVAGGDGALTELVRPGGDPHSCYSAAWSADGGQVYCASYGMTGGAPALWRMPSAGGEPGILIASEGTNQADVFNPIAVNDQLYAFVGVTADASQPIAYHMQRLDTQSGKASTVRAEALDIDAVLWSLWARDGSGAVTQKPEPGGSSGNTLIWTPAEGAPVQLGVRGAGTPQWGAPGS